MKLAMQVNIIKQHRECTDIHRLVSGMNKWGDGPGGAVRISSMYNFAKGNFLPSAAASGTNMRGDGSLNAVIN